MAVLGLCLLHTDQKTSLLTKDTPNKYSSPMATDPQMCEGASAPEGSRAIPASHLFVLLYHHFHQADTGIQRNHIACNIRKRAEMWCVRSQMWLFNCISGVFV